MIPDPFGQLRAVVIDPFARDKALADDFDWREYMKTRDPALVKAKDGADLAWFTLDPLDVLFIAEVVDSQSSESKKRMMAFRAACRSVERGAEKIEPKSLDPSAYGQRMAPPEFAKEVATKFSLRAVYEMGDVAIQRAKLPEGAQGPFVWSDI